jgi:hypothetical protein
VEVADRRTKELKVNIPTELHLQLLRVKFLKGQTIAATVEEALRAYFSDHEAPSLEAPTNGQGDVLGH